MNHQGTTFRTIIISSIPSLGWGRGSGSDALYQVHVELVNQSVCATIYNDGFPGNKFRQEKMICAGDVQNGGRDACGVSY